MADIILTPELDKYYPTENNLHDLLLTHSRCVARKALQIAQAHPELHTDCDFIIRGALLHDIGIVDCDAPGIFCYGSLPYICHGVAGASRLAEAGLLREALVCERHTGSGLSAEEIEEEALPLPLRDMIPLSIEEKIICYADKFFSKNPDSLEREKDIDEIIQSMSRHGEQPLKRFIDMHLLLS